MAHNHLLWIGFNAAVLVLLWADLCVVHRTAHVVSIREALLASAAWIGAALLFNGAIAGWWGHKPALEFLTGYLVEEALSVDNLFIFLLIFSYFRVPPEHQHRVLFWGILGALVMRVTFILAGIALLDRFHWVMYLFGAFLVLTGVKLAVEKDQEVHPEHNPVTQLFRRIMPVTTDYAGHRFFVRQDGRWLATPLFIVLLVVETTDVVFAVDSIPAVLGVTRDPFIAYSSNVCAILGLRSLYFALAGMLRLFHHLHYGLAFILAFVGVKMCIADYYHIPIGVALGVIGGTLALSILASLCFQPPAGGHRPSA